MYMTERAVWNHWKCLWSTSCLYDVLQSSTGTAVFSYLLLGVTLKCLFAVSSKTLMSMWQYV